MMIRKSLLVALLSYFIYCIPAFFIWYYKENYRILSFFGASVWEFFFYTSPLLLTTFVVLLMFNSWFSRKSKMRSRLENNKSYLILTGAFAAILTLGFTFFDYSDSSRFFGSDGDFLNILSRYSGLFLYILITTLIDWKICFNYFKKMKQSIK